MSFKLSLDNIHAVVPRDEVYALETEVKAHDAALRAKSGKGHDYLGWVNLPSEITDNQLAAIETAAAKIRAQAEVLVVVGIGGSYLGARAVIEALQHNFAALLPRARRPGPLVVFAGQNIGEEYHAELLEILDERDYAVAVISKSGTTTEPAIAFRLLKQHLEKKYGKPGAAGRIYAVTDKARGALKQLATEEGYPTFEIPDDVGGRFSVLTPVGLLPIAAAGLDIRALVDGARAQQALADKDASLDASPASLYAAARCALYRKGKVIEILADYLPNLHFFIEWWKQLYGESEGKDGKGIFPAGVDFTSDLHSMGQLIQDGMRNIFETVLFVDGTRRSLPIPSDPADLDKMNYIAGKPLNEVNRMAMLGTLLAHVDGGVPNIGISIAKLDERTVGELIYFFERACGISGYLLGVNPFDQPGVEAYKKNMFALLGRAGSEAETKALRGRLGI